MRLKDSFQILPRKTLLPILRSGATPLFRLAVWLAARTGVLARPAPAAANARQHLLIVHLSSHIGDNVMLLPMIEALRAAHPEALLECVVQAPIGSFLRLVPALDHVYEFEMDQGPTATPGEEARRTVQILRTYWKTMRRVHPTTCIVPRWGWGFRDVMLAYLLQAPNRIGFASNDFDPSRPPSGYRDALLTCHVRGAQRMAEPEKFLFLAQQAGLIPPSSHNLAGLPPGASMRHIANTVNWPALASRLGLDPHASLVVIAPGASAAQKTWPIDRWAVLIGELHAGGFTVVLLSGKSDAEIAQQLFAQTPQERRNQTALVAGVTSLPESICLIAHSELLIGNDSGPGHLAGALGVPCVILFIAAEGADPDAPFAPERIRPMGQRVAGCRPSHAIPPCSGYCTAGYAHCILQIQPEDALQAVRSLVHTGAVCESAAS